MKLIFTLSLLLSTQVLAQTTEDFANIADTIERASKNIAAECPVQNPVIEEYFFIFEGANGYCPLHFEVNKPANVPNETWFDYLMSLGPNDPHYELRQSMVSALNHEHETQNCNLIESLLDKQRLGTDLYGRKIMLYYSKDDDELAFECAKTLTPSKIRVIGYSMGGEAAIRFAEKLKNIGHPVEAGLTIDPVGRGMRWTGSVLNKKSSEAFDVTGYANRQWINVYQRLDKKSLKVTGIQGEEVLGSENTDFSQFISNNKEYKNYAHIWILETNELRERINKWIYN